MADPKENVEAPVDAAPAPATTPSTGVTAAPKSTIQDVTVDGYNFQIDTDRIDDVEILDTIDAIENQKRLKEIIVFLEYLLGAEGYQSLKAYFVEKDGKFRLSKLFEVYQAIFEKFDPKG